MISDASGVCDASGASDAGAFDAAAASDAYHGRVPVARRPIHRPTSTAA